MSELTASATEKPDIWDALGRVRNEIAITSEKDSGFAKDLETICDWAEKAASRHSGQAEDFSKSGLSGGAIQTWREADSGQAVDEQEQEWPDVIGSGGNAPSEQAVDRQEWQKRRYPHARSDSDSWDIYAGETLIVGDLMEDECDKIITAHNAALAAGRADKAEGAAHHMEACRSLLNVSNDDVLYEAIDDMQDQLLSALAAIETVQTEIRNTLRNNLPVGNLGALLAIDVDLSLLHQHDADLRAQWESQVGNMEARKMKLWRELDKHDKSLQKGDSWLGTSNIRLRPVTLAEVRKPLVEALKKARNTIHALHGDIAWEIYEKHAPEMKMIDAALAHAEQV